MIILVIFYYLIRSESAISTISVFISVEPKELRNSCLTFHEASKWGRGEYISGAVFLTRVTFLFPEEIYNTQSKVPGRLLSWFRL